MSEILAITSHPDPHVDMVSEHASRDIIVLDPYQLLDNKELTYVFKKDRFVAEYEEVIFENVHSVWYRKPIIPKPEELGMEPEYREYAWQSYRDHVRALYGLYRDKLWVSDYWNIIRGNNKLYQMEIANLLGLHIPQTVVTNSEQKAVDFVRAHRTSVVKPLTPAIIDLGEETYAFYTTLVTTKDLDQLDFSGLQLAPCIFQEAVPKRLDIRATVVGNEVFTCEIEQIGEMEREVDWRVDIVNGDGLVYRKHQLPRDLEDRCVEMTKMMGLEFGAVEFVTDQQGKYWFMEINPNGQWGFVELETGLPIAKAIAELLESN